MMKALLGSLVAILLVLCTTSSIAFGMGGMYTAKYVDGSSVILLANNVHNTQADVPITYNLRSYDLEGKPIYFGNIQLDVVHGKEILEQHNLRRTVDGDASIILSFSKQGTYILKVRFLDNDKKIAEGEFPIVVSKSPNGNLLTTIATWQTAFGCTVGVAVTILIYKRRRLGLVVQQKVQSKKNQVTKK